MSLLLVSHTLFIKNDAVSTQGSDLHATSRIMTPCSISSSSISSRLRKIPDHLRIFILYSDDDIVVIRKPCLLRSVRGISSSSHHSDEENNTKQDEEQQQESAAPSSVTPVTLSMQEAWVHAIQLNRNKDDATNSLNTYFETYRENFLEKYNNGNNLEKLKGRVLETIINLASKSDQALGSISRRDRAFKNYVSRNRKSLLPNFFVEREMNCGRNVAKPAKKRKLDSSRSADLITCENIDHLIDEVGEIVYKILSTKTNEVYSEATRSISTKDEESADGQLHLLTKVRDDEIITKLYGKLIPSVQENPLYVVHRLDCETSGIMVFARTAIAASILSKSWRDRDRVVKKYVARVKHWPPFEVEGETSGSIHLAMAPMDSERIKWEIKDESKGGKPCETLWKLRLEEKTHDFITLELTPITGRTHQLRVHCAAIGSGIIGDSLYGESPIKLDEEASYFEKPSQILRLHAESLSFPHPSSGIVKTFICEHHWRDE